MPMSKSSAQAIRIAIFNRVVIAECANHQDFVACPSIACPAATQIMGKWQRHRESADRL
jgi:hypothetical protein